MGYWQVKNALFDSGHARQIEPTGVAIYCLLARHAGKKKVCWPSLDTICETLGIARATAVKYLGKLQECGLIEATPKEGDNRRHVYRLLSLDQAEIGSKSEPISAREEIGSDFEPNSPSHHENRFKSCNEIGSKSEPEEYIGKKTKTLVSSRRTPAAPRRTEQSLNIAVSKCCQHYRREFAVVFPMRRPPTETGRDRGAVRAAVKAVSDADGVDYVAAEAEVMRLIGLLLRDTDNFVVKSGHALACLTTRLSALRDGVTPNGRTDSNRNGRGLEQHAELFAEWDRQEHERQARERAGAADRARPAD